ncbi:MAG: hypothetical protein KJO81_04770 [Gammaproteobacteria bacterium]|nr:hypothetical protein [Gammaproteobacteria bacterium]MBT8124120.1 hypothetical protein [Gammaproteobacteria bacterium]
MVVVADIGGDMSDDTIDLDNLSKATKEIIDSLTPREINVLRERFGIDVVDDMTVDDVLKQFDIVRERISEIEEKALLRILSQRKENPDDES